MGYGQSDARGYTGARDGLAEYKRLLQDLGLRDRDPFDTLREDPFVAPETARDTFLRESTGIGSQAPWEMSSE